MLIWIEMIERRRERLGREQEGEEEQEREREKRGRDLEREKTERTKKNQVGEKSEPFFLSIFASSLGYRERLFYYQMREKPCVRARGLRF